MCEWTTCSNGPGSRHWYVVRLDDAGRVAEVVSDKRGRYRAFATAKDAERLVQKLCLEAAR